MAESIGSGAAHIEIRAATQSDNEALLALTRATPMTGTIALRIDRDPDFFSLLKLRGESRVCVAVRESEVVGCISAALRSSYVDGEPELTAYIGDMKVHPRYSGSRIAVRLIHAIEEYLGSAGVDLALTLVAAGNSQVMPLLAGRLGITPWASIGRFVAKELLPSPFAGRSGRYRIDTARAEDAPAIADLLDRYYRSREFGPRVTPDEIAAGIGAAGAEPFSKVLVARHGTRIAATLAIVDTAAHKRNVLLGAPVLARTVLGLCRFVLAPFPGFCMPRVGEPVRVLTARHFACEEGHRGALRTLLHRGRLETFRQRCSFLVIGLHERDPLREIARGMPGFTFSSLAFAASFTRGRLPSIAEGIPYEDYSLV